MHVYVKGAWVHNKNVPAMCKNHFLCLWCQLKLSHQQIIVVGNTMYMLHVRTTECMYMYLFFRVCG